MSCLRAGYELDSRPVHIGCAPKDDFLAVITAYLPDPRERLIIFRVGLPAPSAQWNVYHVESLVYSTCGETYSSGVAQSDGTGVANSIFLVPAVSIYSDSKGS